MTSLTATPRTTRGTSTRTGCTRPVSRRRGAPARALRGRGARGRASTTPTTAAAVLRVPASRVRMTARGRRLVLLLVALLVLTAFAVGRAGSSSAGVQPEAAPQLTQVTVQQGDTLWAVARRVAPGHDPRELVAQIRRLNHLETASLVPGQQLVLPAVV